MGTIYTENGQIMIASTGYITNKLSAMLIQQYISIKIGNNKVNIGGIEYDKVFIKEEEEGRKTITILDKSIKSSGEISEEIGKKVVLIFIPSGSRTLYFYHPIYIRSKIGRYASIGTEQNNLVQLNDQPLGSYSFFRLIPSNYKALKPVSGDESFRIQSISTGEFITINPNIGAWVSFLTLDTKEHIDFGMETNFGKIFNLSHYQEQLWYLSDYTDKATNKLRVIEENNKEEIKPKDGWNLINIF
jgi:hypothetical protein